MPIFGKQIHIPLNLLFWCFAQFESKRGVGSIEPLVNSSKSHAHRFQAPNSTVFFDVIHTNKPFLSIKYTQWHEFAEIALSKAGILFHLTTSISFHFWQIEHLIFPFLWEPISLHEDISKYTLTIALDFLFDFCNSLTLSVSTRLTLILP